MLTPARRVGTIPAVVRQHRWSRVLWACPTWAWVGALAGLYLVVGLRYVDRLQASGDEPHYLLMAQSLASEGDLDLRDNFARGDYRAYAPALDGPHYGAPRADGRPFPAHSPGLPALLAPAYALGGRPACVALLALLAALVVAQVPVLARQLGATRAAAGFAACVAAGPPLAFYAFHVYTEVPSALALALALRLLNDADETGPRPGRAASTPAALGIAACAAALPWLHVKLIPAAAALGVLALARLRGRDRALFLGAAALAAALYVAYHLSIFGRATPLALYGGGLPRGVAPAPLRAALGLLLDRSFGLLPHAPAFVLALAALPLLPALLRGRLGQAAQRAARAHLLVAVTLLAPLLAWRMWWGGMCPPARFLVPLVPSLAALVALRVSASQARAPRGLVALRRPLLVAGLALGAFMLARPEALLLLNRRDRPTRVWEALAFDTPAGRLSLGDWLPSLVLPASDQERRAALCVAALALLIVWDARRRSGPPAPAREAAPRSP